MIELGPILAVPIPIILFFVGRRSSLRFYFGLALAVVLAILLCPLLLRSEALQQSPLPNDPAAVTVTFAIFFSLAFLVGRLGRRL